ncbi:hypothetical protein E3N88_42807 [Mikania micrantha]|uniref:DUF4408 domain-containing protein n=1 Tax=Mikania micrantha TaxID=192012 RepID=A0A5N6LGU6_9ASTR|nr:hypothetical protein E3N88_42807 [Mikania micrantha]
MDSYGVIESIQAVKANALARYARFNKISKMFRAIEVFVAVALILWSTFHLSTVFKVSGDYLYACSWYVMNQHVVFLLGNVIVVLCYVLSGHTEVGNGSDCSEVSEDDRNRSSSNHKTEADSNRESAPPPVEAPPEEIRDQVVGNENAIVKTDMETAIKQAVKQIERFRRTQSAKLQQEISTKSGKELRRSVTERRRSVITAGDGDLKTSVIATVERLSNEEFRLVVEAFISKQQNLLKQQSMYKTI